MRDAKYFRAVNVALALVLASSVSAGAGGRKRLTIQGSVVAYASSMACLNNTVSWTTIIRVDAAKSGSDAFAVIEAGTNCEDKPDWLAATSTPAVRKFEVTKEEACEAIARGTDTDALPTASGGKKSGATDGMAELPGPLWNYVQGVDRSEVPFGTRVACYASVRYRVRAVV